jgi:hypothetical protein
MLEDAFEPPEEFMRAWEAIKPRARRSPLMLRTENGDGSVIMTAII